MPTQTPETFAAKYENKIHPPCTTIPYTCYCKAQDREDCTCPKPVPPGLLPRRFFLIGPQGCGKSTRAVEIASKLGVVDIFDPWEGKPFTSPSALAIVSTGKFTPPAGAVVIRVEDEMGLDVLLQTLRGEQPDHLHDFIVEWIARQTHPFTSADVAIAIGVDPASSSIRTRLGLELKKCGCTRDGRTGRFIPPFPGDTFCPENLSPEGIQQQSEESRPSPDLPLAKIPAYSADRQSPSDDLQVPSDQQSPR